MTEEPDCWPTHAYIPGKTPRHTEGAFDAVRKTAHEGLSSDQLAKSDAFRLGLHYLDAGFYWEAHEVFEPVWMVLPEQSREREFVQGLIQIANGYLKLKMQRPKAVVRLVIIARKLIPYEVGGTVMGVDLAEVHALIDSLDRKLKHDL